MKKTKVSRSFSQQQIKVICDNVCDNIEAMLDYFELEYKQTSRMISMACPIHGGDNGSALNIYPTGEDYRGNWVCRSHGCQKIFQPSIIGFIRGVLSANNNEWKQDGDTMYGFNETIEFALGVIKKDVSDIKICKKQTEKKQFAHTVNTIVCPIEDIPKVGPSRNSVRSLLKIPSQYFIDRNFDSHTLNNYDVGLCENTKKEMSSRVVVPIYDNEYMYMVGCTGRSTFEKCDKCRSHHCPDSTCPPDEDRWKYSKWKHSKGFKSQNHLYNYWFAKKFILESRIAILVESPGNVWKLESCGIHNSVAIFGSNLTDRQKMILDMSGAMSLVILMDNDEAGRAATQQIKNKCSKIYNIHCPSISKPDVADMTDNEIDTEIIKVLAKIQS